MQKYRTDLMKDWQLYCQQFSDFDYKQPTSEEVSAAVRELEASWFRQSTIDDRDLNYMAADDLTVGEWVWLGNDEHVVTQDCAENWCQQSERENNVCNYTFSDIASQFVLAVVSDQLRAYNANKS